MLIRCPHCQHAIEVESGHPLNDVTCPSCGTHVDFSADETVSYRTAPGAIGHFELIEQVGAGKFGAVWKALDTQLDRIVAIKVPRQDQLDSREIEQFLREARAAAQLRHPNIVSIHEVGRHEKSVYIVSDYVQGLTLADWRVVRKPGIRAAAELCIKIAHSLEHAHANGIVHRDLKPSNIMIDEAGEPHLMDFGLAKREAGEATMTADGHVLGTPAYMSPEQARGEAHQADRRSDVYSLGVILFELLTGERPFRGNTRMLLHQVIHDDAPGARSLVPAIPRDLDTICSKCLEKDAARRYGAAGEVADELNRYVQGKAILARPTGRVEKLVRWCRREPLVASLIGALAIVLLAGTWVTVHLINRPPRPADLAAAPPRAQTETKPSAANSTGPRANTTREGVAADNDDDREAARDRSPEQAGVSPEAAAAPASVPPRDSRPWREIRPIQAATVAPRILVKEWPPVTEILLVVDASGSMKERDGGGPSDPTRWQIARMAIQGLLDSLLSHSAEWEANNQKFRLGLILYGHRAAWQTKIGNVVYNPDAPATLREQWRESRVLPYNDVEWPVQVDNLDVAQADRVKRALDVASPWGTTPLYLSLKTAVAEYKPLPDERNVRRHIVLVTDGIDNPMPTAEVAARQTTPRQVMAEMQAFQQKHDAALRLDIVYFGAIKAEERDAAKSLADLMKEVNGLADRSAGASSEMHFAADRQVLTERLQDSFGLNRQGLRFRVTRAGTTPSAGSFQPGGTIWTTPPKSSPLPDQFVIELEKNPETARQVRLEGSESLALTWWRTQLEFDPFETDRWGASRIITADEGRLRVFPSKPAVNGSGMNFRFAVQYRDPKRFTPRPCDLWGEIIPRDGAERDRVVFFDRALIADQPVPVLQFAYPDWPAKAREAQIRLWLQFPDEQGQSGVERRELNFAAAEQSTSSDQASRLEGIPSLSLRASHSTDENAERLVVSEEHVLDGNMPVEWCRIELSQTCDGIVRRYFADAGRAEHVFEFPAGALPDRTTLKILVTPSKAIRDGAVKVPDTDGESWTLPVPGG